MTIIARTVSPRELIEPRGSMDSDRPEYDPGPEPFRRRWFVRGSIRDGFHQSAALERPRISEDLDSSGLPRSPGLAHFGFAHFEAGRFHDAIRYLHRALAETPTVGYLHKHLGPAKALFGRKDEAREHLRGVRRFTPGWEFSLSNQRKVQPTPEAYNHQLANGWEEIGVHSIG